MGNLDSKLSQAAHNHHSYSIIEESPRSSSSSTTTPNGNSPGSLSGHFNLDQLGFRLAAPSPPLWTVKRVNYQNEGKNSLLFEFNHGKLAVTSGGSSNRHLKLAQNQIKMLKGIRHPNIARYLFAEESGHSNSGGGTSGSGSGLFKCVLIVESMRPLSWFTSNGDHHLSMEQLVSGIHGITTAVAFLHDKCAISHNNVNEHAVYLNGKQVWKLSDFELAMSFGDLSRESLRQIWEFRHKESLTPEETSEFRLNVSWFFFSSFWKSKSLFFNEQ